MSEKNEKVDTEMIVELKDIVRKMEPHLKTAKNFGIDLNPLVLFIGKIVRKQDVLEERLTKLESK